MNITFSCPQCEHDVRLDVAVDDAALDCPQCHTRIKFPAGAWEQGHLRRCLVCPSEDLFVRKDFPQRLGVAVVAAGFIGSTIAWYYYQIYWAFGILFASALVDVLLFNLVGEALACYRCHAHYRSLGDLATHQPFNLETHERYRQLAARTAPAPTAAAAPAATPPTVESARESSPTSPPSRT